MEWATCRVETLRRNLTNGPRPLGEREVRDHVREIAGALARWHEDTLSRFGMSTLTISSSCTMVPSSSLISVLRDGIRVLR
jgi:hypothetical protein